ncbi:MAG: hypothetical protein V4753_00310 [Pseudomonadota bacterium]
MQAKRIKDPTAIIVIILKEVLVARDIEMTVRESRPEASVFVARTLHEAVDALPLGRIEVAFVQSDPRTIATSPLGRRIAAEGGRVVVLSEDIRGALPVGWAALPFPFSSKAVAELLSAGP